MATQALDARLLEMLRCPQSGGELHYIEGSVESADGGSAPFLFCAESRLKFRIDEPAIPVLLLEEAESLSAEQVAALLEQVEQVGKGR